MSPMYNLEHNTQKHTSTYEKWPIKREKKIYDVQFRYSSKQKLILMQKIFQSVYIYIALLKKQKGKKNKREENPVDKIWNWDLSAKFHWFITWVETEQYAHAHTHTHTHLLMEIRLNLLSPWNLTLDFFLLLHEATPTLLSFGDTLVAVVFLAYKYISDS